MKTVKIHYISKISVFALIGALIGAHTRQVKKERAVCVKWPV